jgi:fumarylacetoacetase
MADASWVAVPHGSPFPIHNLPYGVVSVDGGPGRVAIAIGDHILDLTGMASGPDSDLPFADAFDQPSLDPLLERGPRVWRTIRSRLTSLLTDPNHRGAVEPHLIDRSRTVSLMPFTVADYVDFYSSLHHARNVGQIFRPGAEPLTPNWRHQPIGYHGRAGTVMVSGTDIVRPIGQLGLDSDGKVRVGPSRRLDIEAEIGFVVGAGSLSGSPVPGAALADHIFGVVIVNDWSARDLQAWEYQPLGPFLGKSFATSISPWVVPLDALAHAWAPAPAQDPVPPDYLVSGRGDGLDIELVIRWNDTEVSRPPFASMYWTPAQQLAHLTSNGASLRRGDLFASGTVSGPTRSTWGSFLELSWGGTEPLTLRDGTTRTFLLDGDTVAIAASAPSHGGTRIGFGEVVGTVLPSPL